MSGVCGCVCMGELGNRCLVCVTVWMCVFGGTREKMSGVRDCVDVCVWGN